MKRGSSGYSLIVGIDKSQGHSSHSARGSLKRTLNEGRVGHCGTLDPFATGVLVGLVGPATGLSRYISADVKEYTARIVFGRSTTTDDIDGITLEFSSNLPWDYDEEGASSVLESFCGDLMQVPPAYSALKIKGRRAYDEARKGNLVELDPRPVHVYEARLISIDEVEDEGTTVPVWNVHFKVSKGTYIRALARDIGESVGSKAYLGSLCRTASGNVQLSDCIPEDSNADTILDSLLDPVALLNLKLAFLDDATMPKVRNGNPLDIDRMHFFYHFGTQAEDVCCTSHLSPVSGDLEDGELVALVNKEGLKAIYSFDAEKDRLVADRVFQTEVRRGPYAVA